MGRSTVYPYHIWTNGAWHEVFPANYDKSIPSLRSILHQYAKEHGFKLYTRKLTDDVLVICFKRELS